MKRVIAIDGPSGAGKSTIARLIADELGFDYLDTGALYRAVALHLKRLGLDAGSPDKEITGALKTAEVQFIDGKVFLNSEDVSQDIRTADAGHYASVFSSRAPVREYLLNIQRNAAKDSNLVAEGRDMTTVVFPNAFSKFYLDATVQERIKRRTEELASKGYTVNKDGLRREIIERDARDSGRTMAPLIKAKDAILIDSTGLSIDAVFRKIMEFIRKKIEQS